MPTLSPAARNDAVVNLSKRRGFVFASSEIYGGTRSAWDYGPLGVELKENVRRQWWRTMVTGRDDIVGLDSAVVLAPQVWVASGHVDAFVDPLTECRNCHNRYREDQLLEAYEARKATVVTHPVYGYKMSYSRMLEVQARMLAAYLRGSVPAYTGFTVR